MTSLLLYPNPVDYTGTRRVETDVHDVKVLTSWKRLDCETPQDMRGARPWHGLAVAAAC